MSEKKYRMGNWKGFASRYVNAMTNMQAALVICDNQKAKEKVRKIYKQIEDLAELLSHDNQDHDKEPDAEEKVFKGYTEAELKAAFEKVCDPHDWKDPIVKRVPTNKMDLTIAAIEFYTATEVKVTALAGRDDVTVESIGYRAGPAGDH